MFYFEEAVLLSGYQFVSVMKIDYDSCNDIVENFKTCPCEGDRTLVGWVGGRNLLEIGVMMADFPFTLYGM